MYIQLLPHAINPEEHVCFLKECLEKRQGITEISKYGFNIYTLPITNEFKDKVEFLKSYILRE